MSLKTYTPIKDYSLELLHSAADVVVGEIRHVRHNAAGGSLQVPVGNMFAFIHPGIPDVALRHWSVRLIMRTDIRYDARGRCTTVVADPERQAGSNTAFLESLVELRDSGLPYYDPALPLAVAHCLTEHGLCTEPLALAVHNASESEHHMFGDFFDD